MLSDDRYGHRAELREAVSMLPKPRKDSRLCPGEQASDLDSMTKEIWAQKISKIKAKLTGHFIS